MAYQDIKEGYNNRLKSKLYGLLCEYEKEGEWEKFLDNIIIELSGFPDSQKTIYYYELYHNLSSLRYLKYEYFRSTIFSCMTLLSKMNKE